MSLVDIQKRMDPTSELPLSKSKDESSWRTYLVSQCGKRIDAKFRNSGCSIIDMTVNSTDRLVQDVEGGGVTSPIENNWANDVDLDVSVDRERDPLILRHATTLNLLDNTNEVSTLLDCPNEPNDITNGEDSS